jgi:hypothetical protein
MSHKMALLEEEGKPIGDILYTVTFCTAQLLTTALTARDSDSAMDYRLTAPQSKPSYVRGWVVLPPLPAAPILIIAGYLRVGICGCTR